MTAETGAIALLVNGEVCIGCTSAATSLVQDGPNRKPICDTHRRIYGERGYQTYPPASVDGGDRG